MCEPLLYACYRNFNGITPWYKIYMILKRKSSSVSDEWKWKKHWLYQAFYLLLDTLTLQGWHITKCESSEGVWILSEWTVQYSSSVLLPSAGGLVEMFSVWKTGNRNVILPHEQNRWQPFLDIYSTSQKFGHTFSFFEKCFLYFYYFLHCRLILKKCKLRKNTYGMMF